VAEVLAHDEDRAWLLLADAGRPLKVLGNPLQLWVTLLPRYAELQRGEVTHVPDHVQHGVPDLRLATLPGRYQALVRRRLPLADNEATRLGRFVDTFAELCQELSTQGVPETIQHDDLHPANVYADQDRLRVLDWGDCSIAHPFASLVVTFHFLQERNRMSPEDPWLDRLRDAYLEPWGPALRDTLALALRIGAFAHAIAWLRQRDALPPSARPKFDQGFSVVLRRALANTA
jgi:hypothetical protein